MQEFNGVILSPDYKLFLTCIYFAGVLTGAIIGAIVLAAKESAWREREKK